MTTQWEAIKAAQEQRLDDLEMEKDDAESAIACLTQTLEAFGDALKHATLLDESDEAIRMLNNLGEYMDELYNPIVDAISLRIKRLENLIEEAEYGD